MSKRTTRVTRREWRAQKARLLEALKWLNYDGSIPEPIRGLMKALVPGWSAHHPPFTQEVVDFIINDVLGWADTEAKAALVVAYATHGEKGARLGFMYGQDYTSEFAKAFHDRLRALTSQHAIAEAAGKVAQERMQRLVREASGPHTEIDSLASSASYNTAEFTSAEVTIMLDAPRPIEPQVYAAYPHTKRGPRGRESIVPRLERKKGKRR